MNTNHLLIGIGAFIVLIGVFYFLNNMFPSPFRKKGTFTYFKGGKLNNPEKFALLCTGILSMGFGYNLNSLKNGYSKKCIKDMLESSWGITDRDSLFEMVNWLGQGGHATQYPYVKEILKLSKSQQRDAGNEQNIEYRFIKNTRKAIPMYEKDGIMSLNNLPENVIAWDFCRVIDIVRGAYTAGLIQEDEAWKICFDFAKELQKLYTSWDDMMKSYLCGRAMWGGVYYYDEMFIKSYKKLLQDQNSPLKTISWNTKLQ